MAAAAAAETWWEYCEWNKSYIEVHSVGYLYIVDLVNLYIVDLVNTRKLENIKKKIV
jgi:hypothetical protein